ncbi:hypothetical protein J7J47_15845 [Halomonas sp. ISL-60]|uniref:hypothetical protein n=1 Tax=Halomonas sp. ISL-56 TaxID=2819149 RepID=UPI001BE4FD8D|nr:hypothetical protein [Halomonas sp. ISL-56]MBT2773700.1 hypothetical protein [Halomonas sp. ISL-60]MBT2803199.1 hypothetical protein [Halomonas sp. ISL-56]
MTLVELFILLAWWFAPPLIIASSIQMLLYCKWAPLRNKPALALVGIFGVIIISTVLGIFGLISPISLPRWLGATENLLFLPMAFIIVGVSTAVMLFTVSLLHRRTSAP